MRKAFTSKLQLEISVVDEAAGSSPEIALEPAPEPLHEADYRRGVAVLPMPTEAQQANFVDYLATEHGFYKFLSARPPGDRLYLYLDPNAGRDRLRRYGHTVRYRDRCLVNDRLHHSWLTTRDYRARFGHLAFSCQAIPAVFRDEQLPDGPATLDHDLARPLVQGSPGTLRLVSSSVLQAGCCRLTRLVDPRTRCADVLRWWGRKPLEERAGTAEQLTENWILMDALCLAIQGLTQENSSSNGEYSRAVRKQLARYEGGIQAAIDRQRAAERQVIESALAAMIETVEPECRLLH